MQNTININSYAPTPEEEAAWEEALRQADLQDRNRAATAAWSAAGMFVAEKADKLGRTTLREAFERGFLEGYNHAKGRK